jgi:cellulose synthase operon protein YhjQ
MPRIAIVSATGGCGRTTLAATLASISTRMGSEAIALDWDPANVLPMHLGAGEPPDDGLARQATRGREAVALQAADGTLALPYGTIEGPALLDMERRLTSEPDWLRARLDELDLPSDGWVFIDTPRWPSVHARQAVRAADAVMVLMQADTPAIDFAVPLLRQMAGRRALAVVNLYDPARDLQADVFASLHERLGDALCQQAIHRDAAIPEALARRSSVLDAAPHSQVVHDLQALMQWLCARFELALPVQSGRDGD